MLTLAQVQAQLALRRYRPGWEFRAYLGDTTGQVHIQISAQVENSYVPGTDVPLDIRWMVPPHALADELALDKAMSWRLQQIEIHESQEWYRKPGQPGPVEVGGLTMTGTRLVPVFNPHRDGADRDEWPIVKRG
jgi:hypothetical protein